MTFTHRPDRCDLTNAAAAFRPPDLPDRYDPIERPKEYPHRLLSIATTCAALALVLVACESPPSQQQAGTVIGGILGGVLGAQVGEGSGRTAATVIGTLVGAGIGGSVGRSMDRSDRQRTAQTLETVRTGVPAQWVNPDTGHRYRVVPLSTQETPSGPCRTYTIDATVSGRTERINGHACRQADGSWEVMP